MVSGNTDAAAVIASIQNAKGKPLLTAVSGG